MTATILVVDDVEQNIKILRDKLINEYYNVITAQSGEEALQILAQHDVDVILLDVMMPNMNGFETCRKIKTSPKTTHIPVVMVTALSDKENRVIGLESGADEFLTKPINNVALFTRVKSLIRMKNIIDELKMRNSITTELGGALLSEVKTDFNDVKVLVVDDDVVGAKNMKKILEPLVKKIKIIPHSSKIDSVEFSPDIVIISCQLDNEDPLRVGATLRSLQKTKNSILIMLSEDENISIVMRGIELGVNDYCIYPIDSSELKARMKAQLRRKRYQEQLYREFEETVDLSIKDGLTGVFNRRYFDIHVKQTLTKTQQTKNKVCLAMLDIDHFKEINDTYGHQTGDYVVTEFANLLKSSFRATDLIARYGGEEFIVLLSNVDLEQAKKLLEKFRQKIENTEFTTNESDIGVRRTVSIGVCEYNFNETATQLISRADKALYMAKSSGRNKIKS